MPGYLKTLRIWESNFARETDWVIEQHGKPIAILTDPRWEDMFWYSYAIQIVATDAQLRDRMLVSSFWDNFGTDGIAWRSCEFGEIAELAFPGAKVFSQDGRMLMRGLHLYTNMSMPSILDQIVLWIRRRCGWNPFSQKQSA